MNKILSDISKRELIVEGIEEVERIKFINNNEHIFNLEILAKDLFKITLIRRVGSFYEL